jgi:hypothetical protein
MSTTAPLLPSRPLAGRVGRVSEANADGVGGLRLHGASGAPRPRPLPATRYVRGGRGEEGASVQLRNPGR